MSRGRSIPQSTEKRSRMHVATARSSTRSRSMMRALVLLYCTLFVVFDIEVVTSMSLDRLGIDRYNEIRSDRSQYEMYNNDRSEFVVEDLAVDAVPAGGETDMYVLLPAGGSKSDRVSVDKNTIESSDEAESIGGGDMLMIESNDAPIVQVASLPITVEKVNVGNMGDTIKSDAEANAEKSDSLNETNDEPMKEVFKNDKDIENMTTFENDAKEDKDSKEAGDAKDSSESEPESMVEMFADAVDEVEKEIETQLLGEESEDPEADEVEGTNDVEKAKWDKTVEKLEEKGSEKNKEDSDLELDEAAAVMEEILPEEVVEVMAVADGSDSSSEEKEELEKEKEEENIKEETLNESPQKIEEAKEPDEQKVNDEKKGYNDDKPKEINDDLKEQEVNQNALKENIMKDTNEVNKMHTTEQLEVEENNKFEDLKEELNKEEETAPIVKDQKMGTNEELKEKEPINSDNLEIEDNQSSPKKEQSQNEINTDFEKEEQDEASTEQPSLESDDIIQNDISSIKTKDNEVLEETGVEHVNIDTENVVTEPAIDEEFENDEKNQDEETSASELSSATMTPIEPINTDESDNKVVESNPTILETINQNENENKENESKNEETTEKTLEISNSPAESPVLPPQISDGQALEQSIFAEESATVLTTILQVPTSQQEPPKEQQKDEMHTSEQQQQKQQGELPVVQEQQLHDELSVSIDKEQEKHEPPAVEQQKENEEQQQQLVQQQDENEPVEAEKEDIPQNEMQIADSEEPNVQNASDALETTQMTIESSTQKPQIVASATEDSVLSYVNVTNTMPALLSGTTTQKTQPMENATDSDDLAFSFSSRLRRYDGAQVWRIVVQNDRDRRLADELQTKFDAQLWKEVKQEVDYLLKPQLLAAAEKHIRSANLSRIVLIDNLQQVIEVENPPLDELADADNEKGHRLTWQAYHRLADIHEYFDYLAKTYPEICAVETIGYSVQRRPLKVLKISNGNAGNPGVWIDGGMHAREWISPASVTYIANQLAEGWEGLPSYMQNINWYIHAVANPDGYEYTHTTDRLWRKNLRSHGRQCPGVDLNRNFGFKWGGKGTSANPCSQIYRGSKAFSEPETFYISKFISSFPRDTFQAYLSFHSYGQYILYPWGYDYLLTTDNVDLDSVARAAATTITRSTGAKYTVGASSITLYPAAGGSDDWAKGIANIKYTYTIEMGDSGRYGFILPANQIETNGRDAYTFVQTVARAISHDARKRAMKLM